MGTKPRRWSNPACGTRRFFPPDDESNDEDDDGDDDDEDRTWSRWNTLFGPVPLMLDPDVIYLVYAVGSLTNETFTLLVQTTEPMAPGTATVYVLHGIPGEDLGLDPELPVDVSVNGACALPGFTFGI